MPSTKQQYNVVLDSATERALWLVCAEMQVTPTIAIRRLLATHPDVVSRAVSVPLPDSVNAGGKRQKRASVDGGKVAVASVLPELAYTPAEETS